MPQSVSEQGVIIRSQSGFFTVQTNKGTVICNLRGRLKQGQRSGDLAAVGDRVWVNIHPEGRGTIETIEPRGKSMVRLDPRPQGIYQQVLLANPDQLVFVFSCAQPKPHLRMLDRFLVLAEKQGIGALIVANKVDLVGQDKAKAIFSLYSSINYPVVYTSARTGEGVDELRSRLIGRISALAGPSGVGKSSLLNMIQPNLGLAVNEISTSLGKGRHTTTVRELFPLDGGGYVADLPGMRSLALWDTKPEELDGYFPEIASLVSSCQFNDCTHQSEPGCKVLEAMHNGKINVKRYESYLRLRSGEK